jgi:hypothetical protein
MAEIQELEPDRLWGDVQFVAEATQGLAACRLVLKWTYVLAHSLEDNSADKNLFCFLQVRGDTERHLARRRDSPRSQYDSPRQTWSPRGLFESPLVNEQNTALGKSGLSNTCLEDPRSPFGHVLVSCHVRRFHV